jgi:hypothetical protein
VQPVSRVNDTNGYYTFGWSEPAQGEFTYTVASNGYQNFAISVAYLKLSIDTLKPTVLSVSTSNANPTVNQSFTVSGTITADGIELGNRSVTFQRSLDNKAFTAVTTGPTNATCWYSFGRRETSAGTYYYRTTDAGNSTLTNATSNVANVTAYGVLGVWKPLSGQLTASPAAVSGGNGRIDVFGRGTDSALWWRHYENNAWSNWEPLGGGLDPNIGPAASSWAAGHLDVFIIGTDHALWHRSYA